MIAEEVKREPHEAGETDAVALRQVARLRLFRRVEADVDLLAARPVLGVLLGGLAGGGLHGGCCALRLGRIMPKG